MDNKLSKPVAQIYYDEHDSSVMRIDWLRSDEPKNPEPLYSQEYVSALLAELESSQAIANEYQQLMYHMDAGGDFYEFQRDKAMKEQSNG